MGAKRALIVDDSKSARAFLSKILEKHDLDVDTAETAERAIEYLAGQRPDVIFMDHLMPGMDGFQAVQAIKNNPRTAMIPIMMYTSQEGELYLSQARALGAVGVLPKQIKPTDVSKVLYQLHLLPDRRTGDPATFKPATDVGPIDIPAPPAPRSLTDAGLREQLTELRRALMANLDSQSERVGADVRSMLLEALPVAPRSGRVALWGVAILAVVLAVFSTALWWHEARRSERLSAEVAELRRAESLAESVAAVTPATGAGASAPGVSDASPPPTIAQVPYGEEPLSGARIDLLRQLLQRLAAESFSGTVEIATFPGRFCLMGNPSEGYSLAPEETPVVRCDLVGNPYDENPAAIRRLPLAFANLVGSFRSATHGAAQISVTDGDAASTAVPYPQRAPSVTAGEWNRAGIANNRIEIRVR